jgi:hypothetical protein
MAATTTTSAEFTLTLTEDERAQLLGFLEQALRAKEIEVHRTESPDYREYIQHEAAVMESLIGKLRRHA